MTDAPLAAPLPQRAVNPLLDAPILPTLLRLSTPNMVAMVGTALIAIAETSYIGRLGVAPLAAVALVFPFAMLTQMMSAGAMGGGVSSAVSRALGAGDRARAGSLAIHATLIGIAGGLVFSAIMLLLGPAFYAALGGDGAVLAEATRYSNLLFAGATSIWLVNTLASVIRGTGDMKLPAATILAAALIQIVVGGALGLGLFGLPRYGMPGVAAGQVAAFSLAAAFLAWFVFSGRAKLSPRLRGFRFERRLAVDILKVGALACLGPLQSVLTILVFTRMLASFGPAALAGYGIGARLEFLLIPIAFSFGMASIPMVGMAIGAGDVARARRVAWTAAAASSAVLGVIGAIVALDPLLWAGLFTDDAAVLAAASAYFHAAGPAFGFFGLGVTLYFASQGAARVGGPVLAATARLALVIAAGLWLTANGAAASAMFALVAAAMVAYGALSAAAVYVARWR